MRRIISALGDQLSNLKGKELIETILQSGGRTVAGEVVAFKQPIVDGITNIEIVAKNGCDIVHINHYDVDCPVIGGLENDSEELSVFKKRGLYVDRDLKFEEPFCDYFNNLGLGRKISDLKQQCKRVYGLSLELSDDPKIPNGRKAIPETVNKAILHGFNYIAIIANSQIGIDEMKNKIKSIKDVYGNEVAILAGRMPWGSIYNNRLNFLTKEEIAKLLEVGVDIIMLPIPNTVIGSDIETIKELTDYVKKNNGVVELTIGTSQESASVKVIEELVVNAKATNADIFQIGDGGYGGIAPLENIRAFSYAIKGERHTIKRMTS